MKDKRLDLGRTMPLMLLLLAAFALSGCGGGTRPTSWTGLAVSDGVVYVADLQQIIALDAESGEMIWSSEDTSRLDSAGPFYTVAAMPGEAIFVTSQERVGRGIFAQPKGLLRAIDIEGDDVLWEYDAAVGSYVASGTLGDGILVIGNSNGLVYAFDALGGDELWSFDAGNRVWSNPLIVSDTVYVTSLGHHIFALDLQTGQERWAQPFETGGAMTGQPLLLEDSIYAGAFDNKLYALHLEDGSTAWSEPFEGQNWFWGSPATDGEYIYAADVNGNVYAIDAETGAEEWSEAIGEPIARDVLISQDGSLIIVCSDIGNIHALDTRDGSLLWTESGEGQFGAAVLEDDVLYITRLYSDARVQAFLVDDDDADLLWAYPQPEDE